MALPRSAELQPAAGHVGPAHDRVVRRIGTGIVKDVLTRKSELQGFKLVEVNPTYTSQACGSCCFISRANRRGNRFECVCCGKQAHPDAQAARNLMEPFREGRTCEYVRRTTLGMRVLSGGQRACAPAWKWQPLVPRGTGASLATSGRACVR